jgi:hypothetical protein
MIRHSTPKGVGAFAAVFSINIQSLAGLQTGLSSGAVPQPYITDKGEKQ